MSNPSKITVKLKADEIADIIVDPDNSGTWGVHTIFFDESGEEVICKDKLVQLLDLPKKTKKIWVTIARSRRTGFMTVKKIVDPEKGDKFKFGKKTYYLFREAERLINELGIGDGDKFYFAVEYKTKK